MACVCLEKNGKYSIEFRINGKRTRKKGFTNKKIAQRIADKIEELITAKKIGTMSEELKLWKAELEKNAPETYDWLETLGLLPKREKQFTVADVAELWEKSGEGLSDGTQYKREQTCKHLIEFFGADKVVEEITHQDAERFFKWYSTAPLDTRCKTPKPYAHATVGRNIGNFRSAFKRAVDYGYITRNPLAFIRGWEAKNDEAMEYVPTENVLKILEYMKQYAEDFDSASALKWRAIIALGRFAGCRGACDLCLLTWDKIRWTSSDEAGNVTLEGKTAPGTIPLSPILESCLADWFEVAPEGERVFPDFHEKSNTSTMPKKYAHKAGVVLPIKDPWYNLRKSFCTDVMESGVSIETYRRICRHSIEVAMKHYMLKRDSDVIRHAESLKKTAFWNANPNRTKTTESKDTVPTKNEGGNLQASEMEESEFNPANYDTFLKKVGGQFGGQFDSVGGQKRGQQEIYQSSTELNETPQNTALSKLLQEIKKGLQDLANPNYTPCKGPAASIVPVSALKTPVLAAIF